jgi:hypothetical protein
MQLTVRTLHKLLSAVDEVTRQVPAYTEATQADVSKTLEDILKDTAAMCRFRIALNQLRSSADALERCVLIGEVKV